MDWSSEFLQSLDSVKHSYLFRNINNGIGNLLDDNLTKFSLFYLVFILLLAVFGPMIVPHDYTTQHYSGGTLDRLEPPSMDYWLGTTQRGEDVFTRILYGSRPTVITGILGGFMMVAIGMSIGVTAGYIGGKVETILMRFTDFVYGVPLIPFALVLIAFLEISFFGVIIVIGLILWRGNARVMRSQVLQIKERPFVLAAKSSGASTTRIIFKHIIPNLTGMAVLFFALGVGIAIIYQANLAFLGVSDPFVPSWGIMVRNAHRSGYLAEAWWWSMIPGLMISSTVLATFIVGRGFENTSGEQNQAVF